MLKCQSCRSERSSLPQAKAVCPFGTQLLQHVWFTEMAQQAILSFSTARDHRLLGTAQRREPMTTSRASSKTAKV
jgi:hypothetical protein